jgi:hypothetical protein
VMGEMAFSKLSYCNTKIRGVVHGLELNSALTLLLITDFLILFWHTHAHTQKSLKVWNTVTLKLWWIVQLLIYIFCSKLSLQQPPKVWLQDFDSLCIFLYLL